METDTFQKYKETEKKEMGETEEGVKGGKRWAVKKPTDPVA